ncbi:MAG: methylated-DNA--[protein]-cysteine S-methyltransferase [marine benthic group bacterium]|jgi:AraC family transcriptional regulator of adaptative response/methylated-DNA-[protein]-cysteine methyltransferase|nr:methylated-DNA--[protein]-cysteine S-methyltransferase [Candidatus Benthicola marisminoris]
MNTRTLPGHEEMLRAFQNRSARYDGVFFTGVRTTGIFCRPVCPARKPKPQNVEFFATARDALYSGYRPCRRCRPMEPAGSPPEWLRGLLADLDADPSRRWKDQDLRERGLHPDRVRRWFQRHHGMTFHAYGRARRLGLALEQIREGVGVSTTAYQHGYESLSGFNEAFRQLVGDAPRSSADGLVLQVTRVLTPLGPMIAGGTDEALYFFEFSDRRRLERQLDRLRARLDCTLVPGGNLLLERTAAEVAAYFAGSLQRFSVPLVAPGTDFQQSVWEELRNIPFGETRSYADVARAIGRPTAVRAVARANGDNRMAIFIPCHRVVGSDGRLTGYGGGLWRKQHLLDLESGVSQAGLFADPES